MTTSADFDHAQQTVCDWLRQNGVDPEVLPADVNVSIDTTADTVTVDVFVPTGRGLYQLDPKDPNRVFTSRVTYPLTTPPPADLDDLLRVIREWRFT